MSLCKLAKEVINKGHPCVVNQGSATHLCCPICATHTHTHTQDGFFPLHDASQEGHDGIVEMLLQAGATVDQQSKVEDYYDSTLFICHL